MKARIIVNRQIVQKNRKDGTDVPPISVKTYRGAERVHEVRFSGSAVLRSATAAPSGTSGATVWIETEYETLELIVREEGEPRGDGPP